MKSLHNVKKLKGLLLLAALGFSLGQPSCIRADNEQDAFSLFKDFIDGGKPTAAHPHLKLIATLDRLIALLQHNPKYHALVADLRKIKCTRNLNAMFVATTLSKHFSILPADIQNLIPSGANRYTPTGVNRMRALQAVLESRIR